MSEQNKPDNVVYNTETQKQNAYIKPYGTGIGLATVKKMVTSLGGEISVFSEESVGTTFQFTMAKV